MRCFKSEGGLPEGYLPSLQCDICKDRFLVYCSNVTAEKLTFCTRRGRFFRRDLDKPLSSELKENDVGHSLGSFPTASLPSMKKDPEMGSHGNEHKEPDLPIVILC